MTVLKKYTRILLNHPWEEDHLGEDYDPVFTTRRIRMTRNFAIWREEPIAARVIECIQRREGHKKLFDFKYSLAYRLIADIQKEEGENHGPWFPHRLRGERACQLVTEYNFNTFRLKQFFEWSTDATPLHYVHLSTEELKDALRHF